jgi:hypothetical protein
MVDNSPAKEPSTGLDLDARPQRELDLMSAELSSVAIVDMVFRSGPFG